MDITLPKLSLATFYTNYSFEMKADYDTFLLGLSSYEVKTQVFGENGLQGFTCLKSQVVGLGNSLGKFQQKQ